MCKEICSNSAPYSHGICYSQNCRNKQDQVPFDVYYHPII